jgi:hypothetical protein
LAPAPAIAQTEQETLDAKPVDERNGLILRGAVQTTYDSNIFRTDSDVTPSVDDIIVTPTVEARYNRTVGPNSISASALAGYDRFMSNGERSKPRFIGRLSGKFAVLNPCTVTPRASWRSERANYGDLNARVENQQRFSELGVAVSCDRPAGFYPKASYLRATTRNQTAFDFADQTASIYSVSLAYARPSLGVVQLAYEREDARRDTLGYRNRVERFGVKFDRSLSSKLSAHVDVHALRVRPTTDAVPRHDGIGWDISATSRALTPLVITLGTRRTVVNDSLVTSGYVLESAHNVRLRWAMSELTELEAVGEFRHRRFRHNAVLDTSPVDRDDVWSANLNLRRQLTDRFRLVAGAGYYNRSTHADVGNYDAFTVTLGGEIFF